jgi:hypothetical protein
MNSWKVILAVMVIFGAGVLTGGLLVDYVNHGRPEHGRFPFWEPNPHSQMDNPGQPHPGELSRPRSPEMWRRDFIVHLDEALKLTPEQHAAISKIIAEGQEQNREIWTNVAPKMRQEMEQVHQRIRSELTPDQQKQFETLTKQFAPRHPPHDQAPPPTNNAPPPPDGAPGA